MRAAARQGTRLRANAIFLGGVDVNAHTKFPSALIMNEEIDLLQYF